MAKKNPAPLPDQPAAGAELMRQAGETLRGIVEIQPKVIDIEGLKVLGTEGWADVAKKSAQPAGDEAPRLFKGASAILEALETEKTEVNREIGVQRERIIKLREKIDGAEGVIAALDVRLNLLTKAIIEITPYEESKARTK